MDGILPKPFRIQDLAAVLQPHLLPDATRAAPAAAGGGQSRA
jgi:hypothetical protein